jgi:hypothetical protein
LNKFFGAAALALTLTVAPAAAHAATTFAQYKQVDGGLDTVVYDEGSLFDTGGPLGALVTFNFLDTMGPGLDDDIEAYLNIDANGSPWDGTISFTRVSDGANLLRLTFTSATLAGGGGSGALFGSTPGGTVTYTSDFIDFSDATSGDFALSFSGITPGIGASFWTGDSTGTFASDASGIGTEVPEPATWAMMIIGFGGIGSVLRRRRGVLTFA